MKKTIQDITGMKVETVTKNFCFRVEGVIEFNTQQRLRVATGKCVHQYSDFAIVM